MNHLAPTMTADIARIRAGVLARVRAFFKRLNVLEVETPLSSAGACPDRYIDLFEIVPHGTRASALPVRLMQSSPEMHMKRLLAAGYPDIFQICRVFRQEERGRFHNPEFTLLEWYRRGMGMSELMKETATLCRSILRGRVIEIRTYRDVMIEHTGIDPFDTTAEQVNAWLRERETPPGGLDSLTDALQYLMMSYVEPRLPSERIVCIHRYPAAQAVLAVCDPQEPQAALRFEIYSGGMELANGWEELADPEENVRRFADENAARERAGKAAVTPQIGFTESIGALPASSGVALGLDRLVMLAAGAERIDQVLTFTWERA